MLFNRPICVCLLKLINTGEIWVLAWSGLFERIKFGPFKEEQSHFNSLTGGMCNRCTFSRFDEWPSFFSTTKGIAANFHWPFYQLDRVKSTRQLMKDFWEQRFYSLPFIATSILNVTVFNQESSTELRFSWLIPPSLVNSDSCQYKLQSWTKVLGQICTLGAFSHMPDANTTSPA